MNGPPPILADVSLDDKYTRASGQVFISGTQALVRLTLMQRDRDQAAGLNTAGYVTGYRGSPLGGIDLQMKGAEDFLEAKNVRFQPGVNEDLAATAVWGTQQVDIAGEGRYDGVFALWYAKGPGVDRSGDALRHGNLAGAAPHGGVLTVFGDDHTCESSTTCHQSEFALVDAMIPILNPAGVQEIIDFGLYGWALSRYSGCWVGLKCVKDTVEVTASVDLDPARSRTVVPDDFQIPDCGVSIRLDDTPHLAEARLHEAKLPAVKAFARKNPVDRLAIDAPDARIGIATTGKSYLDVRQALGELGIDDARAAALGLRVYKIGLVWPLEEHAARAFASGLDKIIVVEEKRPLIESQLKEILYSPAGGPAIVGKADERGDTLFQAKMDLDPNSIALAIGERLLDGRADDELKTKVDDLRRRLGNPWDPPAELPERRFYFCAGCPHSSSTKVPDGSKAYAGIGCHWMVQFMDRDTKGYTHMGGEGATWIGEAPFSNRPHMFQNIGDGTYFHSGLLAIRAAVAAGTNVTYKILFNDAVALTGGQALDGPLTVPRIAQQVRAEGVGRVAVVSDEPDKYGVGAGFPGGTTVHHRAELDALQRELRELPGVSAIVYDQTCAAEKRRRRKRGRYPDPAKRAFINEWVCEGCGDCGVVSNCVAIVPLETPLGRKRAVDQSACNKDFSCIDGFCPSFVTVEGGRLRRPGTGDLDHLTAAALPEPAQPGLDRPYAIVITGVGGTGVVTVGALLGMAAHLEGKGCGVLDMTGLAQKGGAVLSHVRIGAAPGGISTIRIPTGGADLLLGCDIVVAADAKAIQTVAAERGHAVVNSHEMMTGDFTRDADLRLPTDLMRRTIAEKVGPEKTQFIDATRLATALLGDSIATNLLMLGLALQRGLVPVSAAAVERAIEINGVAVEMNRNAFRLGRLAALDRDRVEGLVAAHDATPAPATLDELIDARAAYLTDYQDKALAGRYRSLVARAAEAETAKTPGMTGLAAAAAENYFRLLAVKDEYEIARLFTDGRFQRRLSETFEGDITLKFHLAPPLLSRPDPETGRLKKKTYGPWMFRAFKLLAKLKGLRGTAWDVFGMTAERRRERALIGEYERNMTEICDSLTAENRAVAIDIASLPTSIRGFGHVKKETIETASARAAELLPALRDGGGGDRRSDPGRD
jgi:indolepyruvate ferredoxin oxidoreductase